jgi:hypothetical protein
VIFSSPNSERQSKRNSGSTISHVADQPPRVASSPNSRKRIHLSHPSATIHSKRLKVAHISQSPVCTAPNLTAHNLSKIENHCDDDGPSFEDESRSRAIQTAGEELGFNFRLECYMPPAISIKLWCEAQDTWFEERPILKTLRDLADMDLIAKSFVVPRTAVTGRAC